MSARLAPQHFDWMPVEELREPCKMFLGCSQTDADYVLAATGGNLEQLAYIRAAIEGCEGMQE